MHARTFLCREALWEAFEEFAREQRAPIDDVLSEAMRAYARQRSYGGATGEEPNAQGYTAQSYDEDGDDLARTAARPDARASAARPPSMSPPTSRLGASSAPRGAPPPHSAPPSRFPSLDPPTHVATQRPFTQPFGQTVPAPPPRGAAQRLARGGAPMPPPHRGIAPPPRSQPPPLPGSAPYVAAANPYAQHGRVATRLSLTYVGHTVDVTKDRFLLGRSKSQADLVLDDPNVSRQHAAIERVGDTWVLADLGSTNGCYVGGERISRRQLVDGDIIDITSHEVRCTLR